MPYKNENQFKYAKSMGDILRVILKKDDNGADMPEITDAEGKSIPYDTYIDQLIQEEDFQTAHQFINDFKFVLSLHDHSSLVNQYINALYDLNPDIRQRNNLTDLQLEALRDRLNDIL